jgi:hypothetical protein
MDVTRKIYPGMEIPLDTAYTQGGCAVNKPIEKNSQIVDGCEKLDKTIGNLNNVLDRLENKLQAVLRSPSPIINPPAEGKCEEVVPLAAFLNEKTSGIETQITRVNDIIRRLEL